MSWWTFIVLGVLAWLGALAIFVAVLRAAARGDARPHGSPIADALRHVEGRMRHGAEPIVRALERRRVPDRRTRVASDGVLVVERRGPRRGRRRDD